jgi:hypothetical protein
VLGPGVLNSFSRAEVFADVGYQVSVKGHASVVASFVARRWMKFFFGPYKATCGYRHQEKECTLVRNAILRQAVASIPTDMVPATAPSPNLMLVRCSSQGSFLWPQMRVSRNLKTGVPSQTVFSTMGHKWPSEAGKSRRAANREAKAEAANSKQPRKPRRLAEAGFCKGGESDAKLLSFVLVLGYEASAWLYQTRPSKIRTRRITTTSPRPPLG